MQLQPVAVPPSAPETKFDRRMTDFVFRKATSSSERCLWMPASFREASGRLEIREGGGAFALFGLPFLAAGIFMILGALGLVPVSTNGGGSVYARPLVGVMGLAFAGVGGALVFGRKWTVVDTVNRRLVRQWSALVPLRESVSLLNAYTAVAIGFVKGDSDTADKFPVALKSTAGADLTVFAPASYAEARAGAVAIAEHLRVDLEDATTDHPTRQAFGDLDGSFVNRARRADAAERSVEQPASLRSTVTRDADTLQIMIPAPRAGAIAFASAAAPLIIPALFGPMLIRLFAQSRTPDFASRVFLGLFFLGFAFIPAMTSVNAIVRSRRGLTAVTVSRNGILIRRRGAWLTKTVASIDAAEIIDVDYSTQESAAAAAKSAAVRQTVTSYGHSVTTSAVSPRTARILLALARFVKSGGITVKTVRGLTTFGEGLEDEEVRYLHSIIRRALQG
jgi:hypothetical protein